MLLCKLANVCGKIRLEYFYNHIFIDQNVHNTEGTEGNQPRYISAFSLSQKSRQYFIMKLFIPCLCVFTFLPVQVGVGEG